MKILEVNDYGYIAGGAESYFFNLTEALRAAGHIVLTLTSDRLPSSGQKVLSDFQIAASGHVFNLDGIFNPVNYFQLKKILTEFSPDVVHFHNVFYALSPSVIYAANSYKTFLTLHDYNVICFGDKRLDNGSICDRPLATCDCPASKVGALGQVKHHAAFHALKQVHKLIAPCRYMEEQFAVNGFTNVVHLSHPMVARETFDEVGASMPEKKHFLYLGRLAEQKGVALLLKAIARFKINATLHIAGVGPEETYLKNLVEELGIGDRVAFNGWVDSVQRSALLAEAIAVVMPSIWPENSPMVIGEAALQKVPVIASAVGGLGEMIIHQETGLLFGHNDEADLAEKLNFALQNAKQMQKLGLASWEKAKGQTYGRHVSALEALWEG